MHRACVDRAFGRYGRRFGFRGNVGRRVCSEFGFAPLATEIIGVTAIFGAVLGVAPIDIHAANRILRHMRGFGNIARVRLRAIVMIVHRLAPRHAGQIAGPSPGGE